LIRFSPILDVGRWDVVVVDVDVNVNVDVDVDARLT
jgi:hypothetical protein